MTGKGLREVSNPSELLIPMHEAGLSGTAISAPMFVSMDAHGHSIYKDIGENAEKNRKEIYQKLGIKT